MRYAIRNINPEVNRMKKPKLKIELRDNTGKEIRNLEKRGLSLECCILLMIKKI
jgi:hypothetical protein